MNNGVAMGKIRPDTLLKILSHAVDESIRRAIPFLCLLGSSSPFRKKETLRPL